MFKKDADRAELLAWETELVVAKCDANAANARIKYTEKRIRELKEDSPFLVSSDDEPHAKKAKAGKAKVTKARVKVEGA